ncbi:MAG: AMP-binding protein [Deltaproteobacteria bacterium]
MMDTLPKLLLENYRKLGDEKIAMRRKTLGLWHEYTWKENYEYVKYFTYGLMHLGLEPGHKVAIIGENDPEWYWAEYASQAVRAIPFGIFVDAHHDELKYYLEHSECAFVVAHDQEQVDKILGLIETLPHIKKVIYWDPKGLWNHEDEHIVYFYDVVELGKEYERNHSGRFEEMVEGIQGDDIAVFCYTSGTTGSPKAAMLTHTGLVETARNWFAVDPWYPTDQYLSYLPPAWAAEQFLGITAGLISQITVNFPEKAETVQENMREIGPDIIFYSSRLWESTASLVQAKIADTIAIKRWLYSLFMPVGYRAADCRFNHESVGFHWKVLNFVGEWMLFRPLRDKIGMRDLRYGYSSGAAISPEMIRFFHAMGVNLKVLYGLSETGINVVGYDDDFSPDVTGKALPNSAIDITEEGEIIIKSKSMLKGYYKNEEAFREKVHDGWFHTGDYGYIDEHERLTVIDRIEDMRELRSGSKFSPQFTEIRLRFSPYIRDAMAIGGVDRDYVTAMINIDFENVGKWAEARHIAYTTFLDLSQKPAVYDLILEHIQRVNRIVPEGARIRKFVNLHKEFDADEAELTRSRKIRRSFVEDRYRSLIDALYSDKQQEAIEAPITYRDGRTGTIKTDVTIKSVPETSTPDQVKERRG